MGGVHVRASDDLLDTFGKYLADRRYKENDLSDLTFALANTFPEVKRVLFSLFIKDGRPDAADAHRLVREASVGNTAYRIDLQFEGSSPPDLAIEVKCNDRDYHVGKYEDAWALNGSRPKVVGLLVKNTLSGSDAFEANEREWEVRDWSKFIGAIESVGIEHPLISMYIRYASEVLALKPLSRRLHFDRATLAALIDLVDHVEFMIKNNPADDDLKYEPIHRSDAIGSGWVGRYYTVTRACTVTAWAGIAYDRTDPRLSIVLTPGVVDKEIIDAIRRNRPKSADFQVEEEGGKQLGFNLSGEAFAAFCAAEVEGQRAIYERYFSAVNHEVMSHAELCHRAGK